jgi:hypothetical protein
MKAMGGSAQAQALGESEATAPLPSALMSSSPKASKYGYLAPAPPFGCFAPLRTSDEGLLVG